MSNAVRGIESAKMSGIQNFVAAGKKWGLKFGTNEVALAQEKTATNVMDIQVGMATGNLIIVRALFWAGVHGWFRRTKRPGNPPSMIEIGDMMDEIGMKKVVELVGNAFQAAFPTEGEQEEAELDNEGADAGETEPAPS